MALLTAKDSEKKKDEAPVEAGADSVSDGAVENIDEKGSEKPKNVKAKRTTSFHVPFAPMGSAAVVLPHPEVDKDGNLTGEIIHKQVKLKDQFFSITKKDAENKIYFRRLKSLFEQQGLSLYTTIDNLDDLKKYKENLSAQPKDESKGKKVQKVFGAFHPEHLSSELTFNIAFQYGEKVRTFVMVKGKLFTDDKKLHNIFLKNGFEDLGYVADKQKLSKEILSKKEKEEDEE